MNSRYDVGLRAMYNYHVNGTMENKKVDYKIIDIWKPINIMQEKIYILNKILEKSGGYDGKKIEIKQTELPLLFFTASWEKIETKNGKISYRPNNEQALNRACSRFNDFKSKGLIEGNYNYLAITFTGKELIEQKVDVNNYIIEKIDEFTHDIKSFITLSEKTNNSIGSLIDKIQIMDSQKISKGDIIENKIGNLANIITIISELPNTLNIVSTGISLLKLFVSSVNN